MNNFLKSATPRIVGCIGVVSLIGILRWIYGDEFGIEMFILILPPFIVVGVLVAFACLIEMIFTGNW